MANPIKGEVPLEIGGRRYVFMLGTYGLAALERRMKMPWPKIFEKAQRNEWGIDDVLATFHSGLMKHHPSLTEREAADLMDEVGLQKINEAIGEAVRLMQPVGGGEEAENPPLSAGNGAGTISSAAG